MSQIHGQSTLLSAELAAIAAELTIDGVRKPPARAISGLMIAGSVWRHPFGAERWANEFRGRVVAVYCVHGHEVSQAVCGVLKEQGVEAVVLTGGFEAWKDAGLVVEPVEAPMREDKSSQPSYGEMFRVFGRIGLLSFGGPAGQIALMHRELVEIRPWLDEPRFLHALNFCMLLPGPEAMQLATYSGWLMRGIKGGLLAGLLFVLPGFAVIIALSALYFRHGDLPVVAGILFGLKAAVLAIVVEALVKVSRRALKSRFAWALAISALVAIAFLKLPFPLIVLGAGVIGISRSAVRRDASSVVVIDQDDTGPLAGQTLRTLLVWGLIWLAPLALLSYLPGVPEAFAAMGWFFSKAAIVTFGGAYAVLAYVGQQAVEVHGWLMPGDMLAGLGLAETTPGPLILVLVFVGFLGGAREAGLEPLVGGLMGGAVALFFTFVPCFLWIFIGAPHIERLRSVQWLSAGLSAITAAVVGVIANLAVWFALHVLFGSVVETRLGALTLPVVDPASLDLAALAIALGAGVALLRFHANLFVVLGGATLAGVAATLLA